MLKSRVWTIEQGPGAGLKLRFPQNCDYISGTSEMPVQREIATRLQRGDVFYDIGANVGFFSLIASRLVGEVGHVVAFEPHPMNAATVIDNARLNGMDHVTVIDVAVGSENRRDELQVTDWDGGGTLSHYPVGKTTNLERTEVQVVSLDDCIPDRRLPLPTLIKIDVEGAEMEVIDGMAQTIAQCAPVLLYEIDDGDPSRFRKRWDEIDTRVRSLGYEVSRLESSYPNIAWHVGHSVALPAQPVA
jgi:FkbM family methyltransferase